jgi:hypothetical protein
MYLLLYMKLKSSFIYFLKDLSSCKKSVKAKGKVIPVLN